MKLLRRILDGDSWLVAACIIFLVLVAPHLPSIPYLDGNIDFVQAYDFYSGGFTQLAAHWGSLHPPLKTFLVSSIFGVFGMHTWTYTVVGIVFGIVGIAAMYWFTRALFGRRTAAVAGVLLGTCPLFLSVGIFSLTDYLLTVWVLFVLLTYIRGHYIWCGLLLLFSVLTKETALLLPVSILVVEVCIFIMERRITRRLVPLLPVFISFFVYACWSWYLHSIGQRPWSDWIFTETANKGATFTIINNLITGTFINAYAKENWLHLFVLNYMWVYTVFAVSGGIWLLIRVLSRKSKRLLEVIVDKRTHALCVYLLFGFLYTISVLSFQTYTIPRYVLPVVPLILLLASRSISTVARRWRRLRIPFIVLFFCIGVLALYSSTDPLSRAIWGDTTWMGQRLYNLKDHLSGNDGITYNLQYLAIVQERSRLISRAQIEGNSIISGDCYFLFPDPNNEKIMLSILSLDRIPKNRWCIGPY
jgi:4-amino-4-deoxy-L-arabinose transferase-like glycosyltransferase